MGSPMTIMRRRLAIMTFAGALAVTAALALVQPQTARAEQPPLLAAPAGKIVLEVTGDLAVTNTTDGTATFDRAMLAAMPRATIETSTPWTNGVQRFDGVTLAALIERLGIKGASVTARALNDYSYRFDVADAVSRGALIADTNNDKPMSVRERGPLWIVFPLDAMPHLEGAERHEIQSRMVWQLKQLMFE